MRTFNTEFEVYFEDISPSGKIHLEKIAEWMSMARERYFRATCSDHLKFVEGHIKMFTNNISISVIGNSSWADKITAILTTENVKKISFEMHIDFRSHNANNVIAKAVQRVTFINDETKKFTDIPNDMKKVIVNYLKGR